MEIQGILPDQAVAILAVVLALLNVVVHIAFAVAVFQDAQNRHADGRPTAFVGPFVWLAATLVGGVLAAVGYWAMHYSTFSRAQRS